MKTKYKTHVIIAALILLAFGLGIYVAPFLNPELVSVIEQTEESPAAGLVPVNVSIEGNSIFLKHECRAITFDVTDDQAYSIARGIEGSVSTRPLTHDIFRDVLENFGIRVTQIKIDRFEEDVYKAKIALNQGDKVLEIDVRPSDSIALATRMGKTLYVSENVMNTRSIKVC